MTVVHDTDVDAHIARIARFAEQVLQPLELELQESDAIPDAAVTGLRELGLFGLTIPREYGGSGFSTSQEMAAVSALGWSSAAFRSLVGISLGVGSQAIVRFGTPEQKQRWLPGIAAGTTLASFALTEPQAGSDATSVVATAVGRGDGFVIDAAKVYVTNAPLAGVATVIARTNPEKLLGNRHLSAFLVPMDSPGVKVGPRRTMIGQRGGYWADVRFDGVDVDADALIGSVGDGFAIMMALLDRSRLHVGALAVGQARRLLHEMTRHATTRKQFGRPLADFELIQAMLADSYAELVAMEALVRAVAARHESGERVSVDASATKMFATEAVGRIADRAVQLFGAEGVAYGNVVERIYRDVRMFRFIEGSTQMQQISIGRALAKGFAVHDQKIKEAAHAV